MQESNQDMLSKQLENINPMTVITDVLSSLWIIVLGAAAVAMIFFVVVSEQSVKNRTYTTTATFVVSAQGGASSVYRNLSSAQDTAETFSNVLNSGIMQRKVCDDLQMPHFDATASASVISETNLLELTVTAKTPQTAYRVIRSIMDNYSTITASVIGSTMMEVLKDPEVPIYPDSAVDVRSETIRGFKLGLMGFTALFVLLSVMHDTIKSSEDLADKLDARALGTIYYERKYKTLKALIKRKKTSILVSNPTTSFAFAESYKKIAAKLSYLKPEGRGQVILFTSLFENEGKSTVVANVALTLARHSDRVLLMDCDLRRPADYLVFDLKEKREKDLPAVLRGEAELEEVIVHDETRGIDLLLTTKASRNSTELLSSAEMRELLKRLRERYDHIILDSCPMAEMADAEVLADLADQSVLVVRYNMVEARDLNDMIDQLTGCRAEMAGCILNRARRLPRIVSGGYGYGYGYGYGNYGKTGRTNDDE